MQRERAEPGRAGGLESLARSHTLPFTPCTPSPRSKASKSDPSALNLHSCSTRQSFRLLFYLPRTPNETSKDCEGSNERPFRSCHGCDRMFCTINDGDGRFIVNGREQCLTRVTLGARVVFQPSSVPYPLSSCRWLSKIL